jgi:maltooligosyltrehalose trehalohydrolase
LRALPLAARSGGEQDRRPMGIEHFQQGAFVRGDGVAFRVWAPFAEELSVAIEGGPTVPMSSGEDGMHEALLPMARAGARYRYLFPDGRLRPDPASRLQEGSVHEASTVVDLAFPWTDESWSGVELTELVTYELHVGTFTPEGTLDAIIPRLPELAALGVSAIELMPLAAFDGERGWGYDGVQLYAVHRAYGGPRALQRLTDACHAQGLGVVLDVVYNHLGPSGNYLRDFGPYFSARHSTPWGEAINYDAEGSQGARTLVVQNALAWVRDFHVDALRLDAVHGIVDDSPRHILEEINDAVQALARQLGRRVHVIAESDLNEPRLVTPKELGGYGLASQWTDDFHHSLHTLLTGQHTGYYADFGRIEDLARSYEEAFVYSGQLSAHRKKPHGKSAKGLPGRRFVVAAQNHDQIGNRAKGDRLSALLAPEALRLAAAATILSPFLPLLFMGEEHAETAPFQYFTSFPDVQLGRAVSEGRRKEFQSFSWSGEVPDPQDPATFERSKLCWELRDRPPHASMLRWYRALLAARKRIAALHDDDLSHLTTEIQAGKTLLVRRKGTSADALLVLRFEPGAGKLSLPIGRWHVELDAWAPELGGASRHALPASELSGRIAVGPWHAALLSELR